MFMSVLLMMWLPQFVKLGLKVKKCNFSRIAGKSDDTVFMKKMVV